MLVGDCKTKILKNLLGCDGQYSMYPTVYMGLSYRDPGVDATEFAEPGTSTGYERCAIGISNNSGTQTVMSFSGGTAFNSQMISFGEAKAGAEDYKLGWFGLFTSKKNPDGQQQTPFICGPLDLTDQQKLDGGVVVHQGQIAIFSKGESEQEAAFKVTVTDNSEVPNA